MFAKLATSTLAAALVLTAAPMVYAGGLDVRDDAQLLAPGDLDGLRATVAAYPFSVRIFTTNGFATREDLNRFAGSQVTAPSMVVIAIAPAAHWTSVHFGVATRIAPNMWRPIENSGDMYFRQGQWRGGMQGILATANSSVGTGPAMLPQAGQQNYPYQGGFRPSRSYRNQSESSTGSGVGFVFPLLLVGGIVLALVFAARRRSAAAQAPGFGGGYRDPNAPYGGQGGYYGPQGGNGISPLGAGIAGAAVGGLAGYAIGSSMHHNDSSDYSSSTSYSNDNGGGGYSSDTSSSYDAGGSTSGWDGGGGGDSGGGGGGDW